MSLQTESLQVCGTMPWILSEWMKGLPAVFVALILGTATAVIAYRQYRIAQTKLRLDLFQQRYEFFELFWGFLSSHINMDAAARQEQHFALQNAAHRAYFLFDNEVGDFVQDAMKKAIKHNMADRTIAQRAGHVATTEESTTLYEMGMWFSEEAINVRARFDKFLRIEA